MSSPWYPTHPASLHSQDAGTIQCPAHGTLPIRHPFTVRMQGQYNVQPMVPHPSCIPSQSGCREYTMSSPWYLTHAAYLHSQDAGRIQYPAHDTPPILHPFTVRMQGEYNIQPMIPHPSRIPSQSGCRENTMSSPWYPTHLASLYSQDAGRIQCPAHGTLPIWHPFTVRMQGEYNVQPMVPHPSRIPSQSGCRENTMSSPWYPTHPASLYSQDAGRIQCPAHGTLPVWHPFTVRMQGEYNVQPMVPYPSGIPLQSGCRENTMSSPWYPTHPASLYSQDAGRIQCPAHGTLPIWHPFTVRMQGEYNVQPMVPYPSGIPLQSGCRENTMSSPWYPTHPASLYSQDAGRIQCPAHGTLPIWHPLQSGCRENTMSSPWYPTHPASLYSQDAGRIQCPAHGTLPIWHPFTVRMQGESSPWYPTHPASLYSQDAGRIQCPAHGTPPIPHPFTVRMQGEYNVQPMVPYPSGIPLQSGCRENTMSSPWYPTHPASLYSQDAGRIQCPAHGTLPMPHTFTVRMQGQYNVQPMVPHPSRIPLQSGCRDNTMSSPWYPTHPASLYSQDAGTIQCPAHGTLPIWHPFTVRMKGEYNVQPMVPHPSRIPLQSGCRENTMSSPWYLTHLASLYSQDAGRIQPMVPHPSRIPLQSGCRENTMSSPWYPTHPASLHSQDAGRIQCPAHGTLPIWHPFTVRMQGEYNVQPMVPHPSRIPSQSGCRENTMSSPWYPTHPASLYSQDAGRIQCPAHGTHPSCIPSQSGCKEYTMSSP